MSNLYQTLAQELARGIEAGIYKPGARLPGIRATSSDRRVSAATVVAAYRQLELDGYIEARPRSGFYVRARGRPLPEPELPAIASRRPRLVDSQQWILNLIDATGDTRVINFGSAVADADYLPHLAIEKAIRRAARLHRREVANYTQPVGYPGLREQLARRMTDIGCLTRPGDIVVTNGCQEAIVIALKVLTRPGDTIVVQSPTFHGHLQAAESLGLKVLEIPSHPSRGIALDALQLALEKWPVKACLVIPNFSNPQGACMSDRAKRNLMRLLAKYEVPVIEDDIYGDLGFEQQRPLPLKALDRTGNTIYCSSFSKSLSPGLRVGWLVPGNYLQQATYQKFISSVASNTIGQLAVADMLASGQYARHLRQMRQQLAAAVARARHTISSTFPGGARVTRPGGGYVLWVELPEKVDTIALAEQARARGISIAPGPIFSASGKFRHCMRISCAIDWNERAQQALATLASLVELCRMP